MTKNILSLAALLIASATFTACTNDDNIIDEPQPAAAKTYTLTIEASKGGATTRALTLSADGMTLTPTWKTTETVTVANNTSGRQADLGTLTPLSDGASTTLTGTLTGDIQVGDELYLGIDRDGNFANPQDGTLAYISEHLDVASCNVHVASVDASNNITLTEGAANFNNAIAVVRFHLKDKAGTPLNASALAINIPADNIWTPSDYTVSGMTSSTYAANAYGENDGAGIVYAAIGGCDSKTVTLTATVDTDTYTYSKSGVTFEDGKFYDITVKMTRQPALGDLYYSDGTYSTTLISGKTPIGVIAYLGTDAFTETGTNVGGSTFTGHGLVLCLKNAASGADAQWSTEMSTLEFGDDAKVTDADGLKRSTNVSGYTNTKTLAEKTDAATKYKAAYAAKNYTGLTAPAGTTGWFLPSAQQWVKMQEGLGGLAESAIVRGSWFNNDHSAATAWETAMAKAGTKGTAYDSMTDAFLWYWSSSEYSADGAVYLCVDATDTGDDYGFNWYFYDKNSASDFYRVRPVLAF